MAVTGLPGGHFDGDGDGDDEAGGIIAETNITPLTDIFLVLLIIFMVTTTAAQEEGKNIDLPSAEVSAETTPNGVNVEVDGGGVIKVNGVTTSEDLLLASLTAAVSAAENKMVVLKGDKHVMLGQAMNVLDLAQKAGAEEIAIATQQPEQLPPRYGVGA